MNLMCPKFLLNIHISKKRSLPESMDPFPSFSPERSFLTAGDELRQNSLPESPLSSSSNFMQRREEIDSELRGTFKAGVPIGTCFQHVKGQTLLPLLYLKPHGKVLTLAQVCTAQLSVTLKPRTQKTQWFPCPSQRYSYSKETVVYILVEILQDIGTR